MIGWLRGVKARVRDLCAHREPESEPEWEIVEPAAAAAPVVLVAQDLQNTLLPGHCPRERIWLPLYTLTLSPTPFFSATIIFLLWIP